MDSFNFSSKMFSRLLISLVLLVVVINLFFLYQTATIPILEQHAFRQTQTALTTYWLTQGGSILPYETPVLGYPWSIPMEFPTYQIIVSYFAKWFIPELDVAGRVMSFVFSCLSALMVILTARKLQVGTSFHLIFIILYFASPLYMYWGKTFMIETCSVFWGLAYIYFFVSCMLAKGNYRWWVYYSLCILAGSICALTKVTTFPGFVACAGFLYILLQFKRNCRFNKVREHLLATLVVFLPIAVAYAWTHYTDAVKMNNLLGQSLTSTALFNWNFGNFEQRINELWKTIIRRGIKETIGYLGLLALLYGFWQIESQAKRIAIAFFVLFLIPFLIFTNLHIPPVS